MGEQIRYNTSRQAWALSAGPWCKQCGVSVWRHSATNVADRKKSRGQHSLQACFQREQQLMNPDGPVFLLIQHICVYTATHRRRWPKHRGAVSSALCWVVCTGAVSGSVQVSLMSHSCCVLLVRPQYVSAILSVFFPNRSSLTCPHCQKQSNTFDPFLCISLPIPLPHTRWVLAWVALQLEAWAVSNPQLTRFYTLMTYTGLHVKLSNLKQANSPKQLFEQS